jgi:hypothetical protein
MERISLMRHHTVHVFSAPYLMYDVVRNLLIFAVARNPKIRHFELCRVNLDQTLPILLCHATELENLEIHHCTLCAATDEISDVTNSRFDELQQITVSIGRNTSIRKLTVSSMSVE